MLVRQSMAREDSGREESLRGSAACQLHTKPAQVNRLSDNATDPQLNERARLREVEHLSQGVMLDCWYACSAEVVLVKWSLSLPASVFQRDTHVATPAI